MRLTDPALVLVGHADALLERAALAEADLAAAAGTVAGRARIAASSPSRCSSRSRRCEALARDAPRLRCELVEAEPEQALPALALGDVDLVLGDEWQHQPRQLPAGARAPRPARGPGPPRPARAPPGWRDGTATPSRSPSSPASRGRPATPAMGWDEMTQRTCRELGGFDPDIRHRTNDANVSLALVARGLAVALLPELAVPARQPRRRAARDRRAAPAARSIFAVTRATDAARPSTRRRARRDPRRRRGAARRVSVRLSAHRCSETAARGCLPAACAPGAPGGRVAP